MTGRGIDQALALPVDPELRERHMRSALGYLQLAEKRHGAISRPMAPSAVWGDALQTWDRLAPDARLVNLETAVTRSDDFAVKGINYRMSPDNLACLTAARIDVCSLANNHVLDFGATGLTETSNSLAAVGIAGVGAGANAVQARAPRVRALAGRERRLVVVAAAFEDSGVPPAWRAGRNSPGVNLVPPTVEAAQALASRIAEVARPGDIGVVSVHWGSNWGYEVPESHRRFARALIDSGRVSVVHGHSSHHPRPMEIHRDRLILYGCGDLLNDYEGIGGYEAFRSDLVAAYLARLGPDGALERLTITPFQIRRFRLNHATGEATRFLAARLAEHSPGLLFQSTEGGLIEASWR